VWQDKVRRCHGDLHLRNVCLFEGEPTLLDCLEFSDELASVDVLYDLASLFRHRNFADFANPMLNRYLDVTGEDDGLPAMRFFLSSRAAIRRMSRRRRWSGPPDPRRSRKWPPKREVTSSSPLNFYGRNPPAWSRASCSFC
jgi:Ser/Thr protein kinase RdoA (MazF antagonist)